MAARSSLFGGSPIGLTYVRLGGLFGVLCWRLIQASCVAGPKSGAEVIRSFGRKWALKVVIRLWGSCGPFLMNGAHWGEGRHMLPEVRVFTPGSTASFSHYCCESFVLTVDLVSK